MWLFKKRFVSILLLIVLFFISSLSKSTSADDTDQSQSFLSIPTAEFITQSRFSEEIEVHTDAITFETRFVDDPEKELGTETVIEEGKEGEKQVTTTIIFYDDEEYSRSIEEEVIIEAIDRVIYKGTKIIHRTLDTDFGKITYTQKLSDFWATSYDSTCRGCSTTTATGMKQGYGVVAVDPKVIPMYAKIYVPGYGIGIAGDVGGAVKGKRIDLGFDSLNGQWSARSVDVYLLVE